MDGEPYVPSARPEVESRRPAEFYLVAYNLGDDIQLAGQVLDATGEPLTQDADDRITIVRRTATGIEGFDKMLVAFDPGGLDEGEYTLAVAVTDPTTGERRESQIPVLVN